MNKSDEKKKSNTDTVRSFSYPHAVQGSELSYLIFQVAKAHRGFAGDLLRPTGLYAGQELLLMQLWDRDAQTQSELIAQLGLDASTVTKMVQRLEAENLITRSQSPTDRRATIVRLTSAGKKLKPKVEKMWGALNDATIQQLGPKEETLLRDLLIRVLGGLKSAQQDSTMVVD